MNDSLNDLNSLMIEIQNSIKRFQDLTHQLAKVSRTSNFWETDPTVRAWLANECDALICEAYQAEDTLAMVYRDLAGNLAA